MLCIAGKNEIAVHGINTAVKTLGHNNVVVCKNRTDNGVSNWQPSLLRHANELGVKAVDLEECYCDKDLVFISLEFDRIIKPHKFLSKQLYNIHFSKLPSYKGVYTSAWPILNGETKSGITLHRIDSGIDTGEIIDQLPFELDPKETARSLYFKYQKAAKICLDDKLGALLSHEYTQEPQSQINSSYYSLESIDYKNLKIDTRKTAEQVGRQLRAYSFREFQLPMIQDLPIRDYETTPDRSQLPPGTLTRICEDSFRLSTIDYDMILYEDFGDRLFLAIDTGDTPTIVNALKNGCPPNITNNCGWTPLMISAYKGDLALCNLLIGMGADPNATNKNGTTVIMYAKEACVKSSNFDLCDYLISAGSDPLSTDYFGKTVLDYAISKNQKDAISYFKAIS